MTSDAAKSVNSQKPVAGMRSEIEAKWGKLSAHEIASLKTNDDLVEQVRSKYGLEKAQAQRDVEAFANGRQL